jgi:hypothetical protein
MCVVETSHLAGSQTQPDARGTVRRVRACILPHEGVYRARTALWHKESDKALPAQGGNDRLIRPYGADGLGRFRENELAAMHNLTPHCSVKFVLQCGTTGRGLMAFKGKGGTRR